ncbi:6809_t:CDS:2 [Funneliformis caledonium]|uniref:6809_t:CDS:1 n=1 Tax=Funneliformis caledonium TaxID=1117310 RepID=A0A9N9DVB4_9GLOM|nr:6809_t:CDS:2 [Funneliformis caledonium]
MHSYNPLKKADIIAEIVKKLPLEALDKFYWINSTWYEEIKHEFRQRWKVQVLEYYKLRLKEEKLEYPYNLDVETKEFIERKTEIAKKQVEIERYMLHNGMLEEQKKEIVKYNIRQIAKNVVPWWDYLTNSHKSGRLWPV